MSRSGSTEISATIKRFASAPRSSSQSDMSLNVVGQTSGHQVKPKNTMTGRGDRTIMKLVVDQESQRVLGVHIMGPDAGEMVQVAAIALRMGATKADFDSTMALHPSAAEELVTMRAKWVPPKLAVE